MLAAGNAKANARQAPPPQLEPRQFADVAAGTVVGLKQFERLYVVRVAENYMMANARKMYATSRYKKSEQK